MPDLFEVVIMDVSDIIFHRETKHCVCVSLMENNYLFINSKSLPKYDDFMIEAKNYPFLQNKNRFIACFKIYTISNDRIVKTVGKLNIEDINKIVNKIKKSKILKKKEKASVLTEIESWLSKL
ncbi:MAG: type II toxin-antitoxin system PemK/MazF family toxin [Leptospirales bacterium]|nr:type II toxin-antitoxin system PemK/MazF family toxin [Leptospirales bacterium]